MRVRDVSLLRAGERLDDLQIKGYGIIQHPGRFCFGMDAVLLSSFARVKKGERALDLGTGTGILPILLEAKNNGEHYTGLEIQEDSSDMAKRSVAYNGLEPKIDIITGDIKEAALLFGAASFEVITTNPPYMLGGHGLSCKNEALHIARHETLCTLDDILRESAKILKVKGRFYMVHRPFRLPEIFCKMCAYGIEPKEMRLVYPFADKEPNMVLVGGIKGGNPRMKVGAPLVIYKREGQYTDEVMQIHHGQDWKEYMAAGGSREGVRKEAAAAGSGEGTRKEAAAAGNREGGKEGISKEIAVKEDRLKEAAAKGGAV